VEIFVQGERRIVPENCTVEMVLNLLELVPSMCLVEINGEVSPRNEWSRVFLKEGDRLEIFRVTAGG